MDIIQIMIFALIRTLMRVFCLFPIRQNRILFESYKGKSYSCNPKYLCEYLMKHYPDQFDMVWVLNDLNNDEVPAQCIVIKKKSLKNFYYHMTAHFVIVNMTDDVFIPKRKKQIVINTWHAGGAYKKVGLSFEMANSKLNKWQDKIVRKETTYYVSSSALFTKYNIREAYQYYGDVLECGLPRNDVFFDIDRMTNIDQQIRNKLNLQDKLVILYAPTFRGDFGQAKGVPFILPTEKITNLYRSFGKDSVILNRSHYSVVSKNQQDTDSVINVSDYSDMQELLICADILITDYSSSIWDFALTEKPCILYVPDRNEYLHERGTYTPMEDWPGFIANNEEELVSLLASVNEERARAQARASLEKFCSYEKGTACQAIVQLINEV